MFNVGREPRRGCPVGGHPDIHEERSTPGGQTVVAVDTDAIEVHGSMTKRRGTMRRSALLVIGVVVTMVFGMAQPAMAWGTVSFGPPSGCTGSATASSWRYASGLSTASTRESGNWCPFGKKQVFAGLVSSGGGYAVSGWAYDSISYSTYSSTVGSIHYWGGAVATP